MGNKYALLIGCNYPGTRSELKGCCNDIREFYNALVECLEWDFEGGDDITVMEDTNDLPWTQPTGKNIKAHLNKIVKKAQDGDILFVHFSGHGCQVPTDDPDEPDGKDECIVPCDMNLISDDDLQEIFAPLGEKGVKLTFTADCCHSGTLLDHKEQIITGPKNAKPATQAAAKSVDSVRDALGEDDNSREIKNRNLPVEDLEAILAERIGTRGMEGSVRDTLSAIFGEDYGTSTQSRSLDLTKGMAPKRGVDEDVGILVSGCLDRECAADCRPAGKKPYGAFTKAMTTVLKNGKEKNAVMSNRELVLAVRENLAASRLRQSPCLECDAKWADAPFILPGTTLEAELKKKAKIEVPSAPEPQPPAPSPPGANAGAVRGYLVLRIKEATGRTNNGSFVWETQGESAFAKADLRGVLGSVKAQTKLAPLKGDTVTWMEDLVLEVLEGSNELRILICRAPQDQGGKKVTPVMAACGIFVDDIIKDLPFLVNCRERQGKSFELFRPKGGRGGSIRVCMNFAKDLSELQQQPGSGPGKCSEAKPTRLNTATTGYGVQIGEDGCSARYTADGSGYKDVGSVMSDKPVPRDCGIYYYEVQVADQGNKGSIAIGFADANFKLTSQPGWEANSYGYHGDDGHKYSSCKGEKYGPTFGTGDVIGAGIHLGQKEIFFTKNGVKLDTAFRNVQGELYPVIGMHSKNESVRVNFQGPFKFDIEGR